MKILVIRNDKLGDFVQAFPAFAMLKASNPELKLTALVPLIQPHWLKFVPI